MMTQLELNISIETKSPTPKLPTPLEKDCWQTPPKIVRLVKSAFQVSRLICDPCTSHANNTGASIFYTPDDDGLTQSWGAGDINAYINPPYSNPAPWIEAIKSKIESGEIKEAISLLPTACLSSKRTGDPAKSATAICIWQPGRIHFINPSTGLPAKKTSFTSALLYWGQKPQRFLEIFEPHGLTYHNGKSRLGNV